MLYKLFAFLAALFFCEFLFFVFILLVLVKDILTATIVVISVFVVFVILFSGALSKDEKSHVDEIQNQENDINDSLVNEDKGESNNG